MGQGNPAAQAMLQAQNYGADQSVLANQFRANQGKKDQVYAGNRATLNDARLKNLGIFDQQYARQALAKSNTKATTQAALNSISDKYAKNRLEQRTLKTYENMYNYRFGKDYRAKNVNELVDWKGRIEGSTGGNSQAPEGMEVTGYDKHGRPRYGYPSGSANRDLEAAGKTPGIFAKRGTLVRAYKKF